VWIELVNSRRVISSRTASVTELISSGETPVLKTLIPNIRAALQHVKNTAEQFKSIDPWTVFLRYVSNKIAPLFAPFTPPNSLPATG
jgi:hypothetical protein